MAPRPKLSASVRRERCGSASKVECVGGRERCGSASTIECSEDVTSDSELHSFFDFQQSGGG